MTNKHLVLALLVQLTLASPSLADVLIDGSTLGHYNNAIGTTLNGTDPNNLFPTAGDPVVISPPEPDLTAASGVLGDWLLDPANLNANWSGRQVVPAGWTVGSETAIVYEVMSPLGGLSDFQIEIGVDNGAYVWFDGVYIGGGMKPGGAFLGEITLFVGDVAPGTHHVAVIREDHGFTNDYLVRVTATLPPTTFVDLGGGSIGIAGEPVLMGSGTLAAGTSASLALANAPPAAIMLLWFSFAPMRFMALGGTVHAFPFANQLTFFADASGRFAGTTTWPAGIPPGTEVWFQFLVEDSSTVHGITLSNGLKATSP